MYPHGPMPPKREKVPSKSIKMVPSKCYTCTLKKSTFYPQKVKLVPSKSYICTLKKLHLYPQKVNVQKSEGILSKKMRIES